MFPMKRLVFVDDDQTELTAFADVVRGTYDYISVHWPNESVKLFSGPPPHIFVSDLYLPPSTGDSTPTAAQREAAARASKEVGTRFSNLYANAKLDDKARLKETMQSISAAYEMLQLQWTVAGPVS
jgi:hypothetical protein